jgi:hypothetical protein
MSANLRALRDSYALGDYADLSKDLSRVLAGGAQVEAHLHRLRAEIDDDRDWHDSAELLGDPELMAR